nr:ATP-binding cassette domain-containing protein [Fredinandcohnia onubensis]
MISIQTQKQTGKIRLNMKRATRINLIIVALSVLLMIIFGVLRPNFLNLSNFINMGHQMSVTAVVAFAMTAVILAKGIDLSVGSTLAVSGVVGALSIQNGVPSLLALLIVILVGALIGALNGLLITRCHISPFIATLGTMAFGSGAALSLSNASSISIDSQTLVWLGSAKIGEIPISIILVLILLIVWWVVLQRTVLGRYIYALGGNYEATRASAIKVRLIQFLTYVFTGASAGIASILLIGRVQSAQPLGGYGLEFDVITAVIIGGTLLSGGVGGVVGTLFGAILVTIIRTGLSFFGAPQEVTYIVTGTIVLVSVILYNLGSLNNLKKIRISSLKRSHSTNVFTKDKKNHNMIKLNKISKSYSGFLALNDINFDIKTGEVVALVGENGAGKSTLVKILSGNILPSKGHIEINNNNVVLDNARKARDLGIGVVHQHYSLVPELTIAENIFLGREAKLKGIRLLNRPLMVKKTKELLNEFDIKLDPEIKVSNLTIGQRQLIEVVKATMGKPWLLIMDEPTSSLSKSESEKLYHLIDQLKEKNVAILYISHKMEELYKLCDRAIILRDGTHIGNAPLPTTKEEQIVNMMVGRNIENIFPYTKSNLGNVVIKVDKLNDGGLLRDASFEVREGEVVVLAGLMGSGRTEVLKSIYGLTKIVSGTITLNGKPFRKTSPKIMKEEMEMAYIPEDRHGAGFIPMMSVRENLSLVWIQKNNRMGLISTNLEKLVATEMIQKVNVKPPEPDKEVIYLSGGNQQKVVLGKWLVTNPKILLLDDPTRGVDVGAKSEIHELIAEYKKQGCAILMVSSELPEALNVADRIVVMHEGRSVGELKHGTTEEQVMHYALGMYKK